MLQPYIKSFAVFKCPSNPSAVHRDATGSPVRSAVPRRTHQLAATVMDYGGENSYGHNDIWMSPRGELRWRQRRLPVAD